MSSSSREEMILKMLLATRKNEVQPHEELEKTENIQGALTGEDEPTEPEGFALNG